MKFDLAPPTCSSRGPTGEITNSKRQTMESQFSSPHHHLEMFWSLANGSLDLPVLLWLPL